MIMLEEQKVYIKGIPERMTEIIKALENLGGHGNEHYLPSAAEAGDSIFFIRHDGVITFEYIKTEAALVLMDNYREIKLTPQKFKDGDILADRNGHLFAVFKEYTHLGSFKPYVAVSDNNIISYLTEASTFHLATESEVKKFQRILNRKNLYWDSAKKQLTKRKWKPEDGESFYYVSSNGSVLRTHYKEDFYDDRERYNVGNCFQTRHDAESVAKKFRNLLKKFTKKE